MNLSQCRTFEDLFISELSGEDNNLCYVLRALSECFEDLLVVLQVDVGEHVRSHFVSFAEVSLQALVIDFTLKLCYHWPGLYEADTEKTRREVHTNIILLC